MIIPLRFSVGGMLVGVVLVFSFRLYTVLKKQAYLDK